MGVPSGRPRALAGACRRPQMRGAGGGGRGRVCGRGVDRREEGSVVRETRRTGRQGPGDATQGPGLEARGPAVDPAGGRERGEDVRLVDPAPLRKLGLGEAVTLAGVDHLSAESSALSKTSAWGRKRGGRGGGGAGTSDPVDVCSLRRSLRSGVSSWCLHRGSTGRWRRRCIGTGVAAALELGQDGRAAASWRRGRLSMGSRPISFPERRRDPSPPVEVERRRGGGEGRGGTGFALSSVGPPGQRGREGGERNDARFVCIVRMRNSCMTPPRPLTAGAHKGSMTRSATTVRLPRPSDGLGVGRRSMDRTMAR